MKPGCHERTLGRPNLLRYIERLDAGCDKYNGSPTIHEKYSVLETRVDNS